MDTAVGLIIAFALIAIGGVSLAAFAIAHRQRDAENSGGGNTLDNA